MIPSKPWKVDVVMRRAGECIGCPNSEDHFRRNADWPKIVGDPPRQFGVVWTWMSELILREQHVEAIRAAGLRGLRFDRVATPSGAEGLFLARCDNWQGDATQLPHIEVVEHCAVCGKKSYQLPRTTDWLEDICAEGPNHFFRIWPFPRFIFVADETAAWLERQRWVGLRLRPITELDFSDGIPVRMRPRQEWDIGLMEDAEMAP